MLETVRIFFHSKKTSFLLMILGIVFSLSPWGSAAMALLAGVLVAVLSENPYAAQTRYGSQKCLALSIVGLGAGMNLITVGQAGLSGLGITLVSITLTLLMGWVLGNLTKSDRETSLLISVGTAICGGSAIAAIAPVIKAKPHSITVSIGTIFILNALALIAFPSIGHYFDLSQKQFGLWTALSIHDTSSVVGAGMQYGPEALQVGTTVKLARALWIVPLTFGFGLMTHNTQSDPRVPPKKPWFILGFLVMAGLVTWRPELQDIGHSVEKIARKLLVLTLFLIGSNLTLETLKTVGVRPFVQGLSLWIIVSVTTLFFVKYIIL